MQSLEQRESPPGDSGFASSRIAATHYALQIQHNCFSLPSASLERIKASENVYGQL